MPESDDNQMLLFADCVRIDENTFKVIPRKLEDEITSAEACRILNCRRQTLNTILNTPKGQEIIRWRWQTPRHGKRLFDRESILEFRKATRDPEFGNSQEPLI